MQDKRRDDMQRRENYLYVGMDLHKDTHTAVMVNCWNEKLDVIVIENKPSEFSKLAKKVDRTALKLGLSPIYGLENAYGYGRSLAVWLIEKGYIVKDVNPSLAYDQRKSAPMMKKNDEHDAYCVATVLINQLHTLPDAKPEDNHWTLSQLVNRRDTLIKDGIRLKNALHEQVSVAYPSYRKFFCEIDRKTALYFWKMVSVSTKGKPYNPIFRAYFLRKTSEGKTKSQALVCVMRRLVNIIYGMMKNKTEYRPPELLKNKAT